MQEELRDIIGRYASAISSRDLSKVRAAFPGISPEQLKGFENYFGLCKQLQATLVLGAVEIRESTADGRVNGRYECNGRPERQAVAFRASFERDGGRWRLVATR